MKIIFICGSLEQGRDGVGDYVRLLAKELIMHGVKAYAISLYDKYVTKAVCGIQETEGVNIPVLRLPLNINVKERFKLVEALVDEFHPHYISIQFVPFSFNPKGLSIHFAERLKTVLKGKKVHLMIHEMWVGKGKALNFKQNLYSGLQKAVIARTLKLLNPNVIHTHLPFYKMQLQKLGWEVETLPLFSNIPFVTIRDRFCTPNIFTVGFFSQVEANDAITQFLIELEKQCFCNSMELEVILIGGESSRVQSVKKSFEALERLKNRIKYTGYLDQNQISCFLQQCRLGVTPVPRHALGKSGSVAAFLAHGVPVAAPVIHPHFQPNEIGFFSEDLCSSIVTIPHYSLSQSTIKSISMARERIALATIGKKFLFDLN